MTGMEGHRRRLRHTWHTRQGVLDAKDRASHQAGGPEGIASDWPDHGGRSSGPFGDRQLRLFRHGTVRAQACARAQGRVADGPVYGGARPLSECAFSYVGHSNGTYLVARALKDYPAARFHRIVFAGSVVRCDYDWLQISRPIPGETSELPRVDKVLNFTATGDWVVALFPKGLQPIKAIDLGSAGHDGFVQGFDIRQSGTDASGRTARRAWFFRMDMYAAATTLQSAITIGGGSPNSSWRGFAQRRGAAPAPFPTVAAGVERHCARSTTLSRAPR